MGICFPQVCAERESWRPPSLPALGELPRTHNSGCSVPPGSQSRGTAHTRLPATHSSSDAATRPLPRGCGTLLPDCARPPRPVPSLGNLGNGQSVELAAGERERRPFAFMQASVGVGEQPPPLPAPTMASPHRSCSLRHSSTSRQGAGPGCGPAGRYIPSRIRFPLPPNEAGQNCPLVAAASTPAHWARTPGGPGPGKGRESSGRPIAVPRERLWRACLHL